MILITSIAWSSILEADWWWRFSSPGQYLDGTTDVTRTMHYGQPTEFQREAYTRVLMGVIDLASTVVNRDIADVQVSLPQWLIGTSPGNPASTLRARYHGWPRVTSVSGPDSWRLWLVNRSLGRDSTIDTAPATASAPTSASTKVRITRRHALARTCHSAG